MAKKLPRISRADQVYEALKDSILSHEWEVGEKIPPEAELAEAYGVNKLTVRMALQKLNVVGLLETRVGEGSFVCGFDMLGYFTEINSMKLLASDEQEIADFRSVLQTGAILLAIEKNPPDLSEKIHCLEDILKNMERTLAQGEWDRFMELDYQFHMTVCKLSGNVMMKNIAEATERLILENTRQSAMRSIRAGRYTQLLQFHREILEAIRERNLERFLKNERLSINQDSHKTTKE